MENLLKAKNQDEKFFAIGVEEEEVEEALTYYKEREPKVQKVIDQFIASRLTTETE